ncbi:MAG: type IV pilus secretin PilQ [Nitrospirae bacterium]|nr:type IV pilus secretin PilQ [Nitrospirota bacterium]
MAFGIWHSSVCAQDKGPLISIELRDVELGDVMRAIGQEHGINIIVDEKITGKVTVSLRNVPLWEAIDSILKDKGYAYIREENILRIIPSPEDEDLITRTLNIKYSSSKDLEPVIKKVLSKKGDMASDTRTNTIIIKDTPSAIKRVEQLLKQIDVKTGQVMIEARIVEVSTNAVQELGIQWSGSFNTQTWPNTFDGNFSVNTPTGATGTSGTSGTQGGTIGLSLGYASIFSVDLQLSALEEHGYGRILSSPKIMVLDNQEATIASGQQIIIRTTTTGTTGTTTGTTEKEATLRLTVTPHVIDNEQLSLKISTKREEFDFSRAVDGLPPKNTREAQTGVIMKNGETIVIGGIYTENNTESDSGLPLLSKIPVLGWLFKKESKKKDRTELLIFITPHIRIDRL